MLTPTICRMKVEAPRLARAAKPGQFVQVLVEGAGLLLRRPLGIAGAVAEQGTVELFYRVLGKGTAKLTVRLCINYTFFLFQSTYSF